MAKYKRKQKLINSRLQLKMIAVFLSVSCVASLFQVILLNRSMMAMAKQLPTEGDLLLSYVPGILTTNMVLTAGVLFPLTFLVGLIATHRVAGPAFSMTRYCKQVAAGEDPGPAHVRDDDELQDLCEALNAAMTRLRSDAAQAKASPDEALEQAPSLITDAQGDDAEVEASADEQA